MALAVNRYSPVARALHWLTALVVLLMIPIGVIMADRGERNLWDGTTNALYSTHKLLGFILLWLVIARIGYRLIKGAPPPEPGLTAFQRKASAVVHGLLYVLLIGLPLGGWIGVSLFPALGIFDLFSLPALTAPDQAAAKQIFAMHKIAGMTMAALILLHIAAALYHHFVRKDGVLLRMMPPRA
jgi:cytochrome b561